MLRVARYGKSRYWAVWDDQELVAVVVYKKGATELVRRLEAQAPAATDAAAQAAAVRQAQELAAQARALARQAQDAAQAVRARAQPSG